MARIPEEIISQVLDRCDIVDVVSGYVSLKKAGRNFKALSPFTQEKTPSFIVSPDKQIYHCFSTGEGGNVIGFVMKMEGLEFPKAVRLLADRVGIKVPDGGSRTNKDDDLRNDIFNVNQLAADYYHDILLSDKTEHVVFAREYLKKRQVNLDTVKSFKIGFAHDAWDGLMNHLKSKQVSEDLMEKAGLIIERQKGGGYYDRFRNRIIFPILDAQSRCVAFGARTMKADDVKYINSPETRVYVKGRHLYGLNVAKKSVMQEDVAVITEGYMDCIMPFQAGVQNVVASLGTALTIEQIRLLKRYSKNVIMLYDTDPAGVAAMIRSFDLLVGEGMDVRVACLAQGEDPDSYIRLKGVDALKEELKNAKSVFDYVFDHSAGKNDISTVEGKTKVANEVLPLIKRFESSVARSGYIKELSKRLAVDVEAVDAEIKKIDQKKYDQPAENKAAQTAATAPVVYKAVEKNLLKILLEEEEEDNFIGQTKNEINAEDFKDQSIRHIISTIYELFESGGKVNSNDVLNRLRDTQAQRVVTQLLTDESLVIIDKKKTFSDCVSRIKKDRIKNERQLLIQQMQEAQSRGDDSKLDELRERFNALITL